MRPFQVSIALKHSQKQIRLRDFFIFFHSCPDYGNSGGAFTDRRKKHIDLHKILYYTETV